MSKKNNAKAQPADENLGAPQINEATENTETSQNHNTEQDVEEQETEKTDLSVVSPDDQVFYVPTNEMCENMAWPNPGTILIAKVHEQKPSGETLLKIELRPGQNADVGCFYNKKKLPGTWHR